MARLQMFDRSSEKMLGFMTVCKLYIRIKMRGVAVEEQIQWLSYVQGRSVDVWKENILKDLEEGLLKYETAGEFLANIRKEFKGGDKEIVKIAELKMLEQGGKTIEEFV